MSPSANIVLAVPGPRPGTVHVELYDIKQTQVIQAHNNALTQLCLNLDGTKLATASEKVRNDPQRVILLFWRMYSDIIITYRSSNF